MATGTMSIFASLQTTIRIASIDHLITLKRETGRPQDLADIEQLEAIRRRKGTRPHDA
jgi:hypothetical protein